MRDREEPELVVEARRAQELYTKEVMLFRRADAIVMTGILPARKPGWREDSMNMVEGNVEFSIDVLKSDEGKIAISFDSPLMRRVIVKPLIGSARIIDLEEDDVLMDVLDVSSSSCGRKATEDDLRQFGEILLAFDMRGNH